MRPKVLRIRFWPLREIAIYAPRCGPLVTARNSCHRPCCAARSGGLRCGIACEPAPETPMPGVRTGSHPGLAISILGAASGTGIPGAAALATKVVADLPYFDSRARIFKLLLDFCRLFLVDPFLDRLRRGLDEVFRLLEAERGDRADFLDHVDLLLADRGEDHVELGLLGRRIGGRRRAAGGRRDRRR